MSSFSDQLKAQADIVKLIGEVVPLRPAPSGGVGICPFHGEKTASFHVHAQRQFYYCFGCHAHGDVFNFFMETRKLTFPEAVALVAERLNVPLPRERDEGADPQRAELLRLHVVAEEFFRGGLAGAAGAPARAYLESRELAPGAWARFHLGWAPEDGRALTRHLQAAGFSPELALRGGLCQMRRDSNAAAGAQPRTAGWVDVYDRFRGRLIFPIADERGRVIAFGARILTTASAGAGERTQPKYLNSPESPIYTKGRALYNLDRAREAIRGLEQPYVILVEGYLDCIRVDLAGFHNVVASCGTALGVAQIELMARLTRRALINFDPDAAGAAAAERSVGLLLEADFEVRVVRLEDGLDPDLFVRRRGREAYAAALSEARPYFNYLAERARRQFDLRRPEGKVAALNHLLPYVARVQNPVTRQNLAENLAAELRIEQPIVRKELARAARERRPSMRPLVRAALELLPAERLLLRSWLEWEAARQPLLELVRAENLLEGLGSAGLLERLDSLSREGRDTAAVAAELEPAERQLLAELLLGSGGEEPLTEASVNAALDALRERRGGSRDAGAALRQLGQADRESREELLRREHQARSARHKVRSPE